MEKAQAFKAGKYCPVCEKVYREALDFCPVHPTVLMVRLRDWGEGFNIFVTKGYDNSMSCKNGHVFDVFVVAGHITIHSSVTKVNEK